LDRSHFPTADGFDYATIRAQCADLHQRGLAVCFGTAGDMDFINSIARARGTEQVLIDLATDDPVYLAIMEARFQFYYEMHRRALEAAGGLIDFAHIGEDLGTQIAQIISHETFEKHFAPKFGKYFAMVHAHGARTMMPICGCAAAFLPRLIELGLDVYDVVQPTTPQMDIAVLAEKFGAKLIFCGSVCVQTTLAFGTPAEVEAEVKRRLKLFPNGGLFLGPTHVIQVGSPLENILALYRTAGSLRATVDQVVRGAGGTAPADTKVNRSKLF
jgi:uroporphyrinogen decarboxylase